MSTPTTGQHKVVAENVHKSYGRNEVLKGVNLTIDAGQVACIIGPSGGGKSTFLRCINHLEKIDSGRLSVDGELIGYKQRGAKLHEMKDKEVAEQRRSIGMVFQRFNLFPHMTAAENVMAGPVVERSDSATAATATPCSCPVASSSALPSHGRWRWTRT